MAVLGFSLKSFRFEVLPPLCSLSCLRVYSDLEAGRPCTNYPEVSDEVTVKVTNVQNYNQILNNDTSSRTLGPSVS